MSHIDKCADPNGAGMCWKYGSTVKEIAKEMQCSESAVWQLLSSALKKMRKKAIEYE